jgi:hypothetical protein
MDYSKELVRTLVSRLSTIPIFLEGEKCEESLLVEVRKKISDCLSLLSSCANLATQPLDWDATVGRLKKLEVELYRIHGQIKDGTS